MQTYQPKMLQEGQPHPDPIVETASLARSDPPRVSYQHSLGDPVRRGALSSLQLESIVVRGCDWVPYIRNEDPPATYQI